MRSIVEELMIVALEPNGKVDHGPGTSSKDYVSAALLMDLVVAGKVGGTDRYPSGELIFQVTDTSPTGNATFDAATDYLGSMMPARILDAMTSLPDYTEPIIETLVTSGVFRSEAKRRLGFKSRAFELSDTSERAALRQRLDAAPSDVRSAAVGMLLAVRHQGPGSGWSPSFHGDLTDDSARPIGRAMAVCLGEVGSALASLAGVGSF